MKKARHTTVIWARRILLALTLIVVVGIAALYFLGREQRSTGRSGEDDGASMGSEGSVLRLSGKGFAIDLTDEGRRLASVSASRLASRREDTFFLEDVRIEAEREDGGVYRISSREATYNLKANTADLEGEVRIEGPGGMSLSAEGLQMRRHGRTVVSTGPVSFSLGPNYLGSANLLDANLRRDAFVLAGDVQVRTVAGLTPAVSLDSQRAAYDRDAGILRTEGDVDLRHGEDRVLARRLTVHLAEDEQTIRFAQAFWDVHAVVHIISGDGVPHELSADAHELTVQLDDLGRPLRLELVSGPHPPTWVRVADASGLVRVLEAAAIDGLFAGGRLSRLDGRGAVRLTETLALDPQPLLRSLCGETLTATFDAAGEIDAFAVDGSVDYTEPWSQAETRSMVRDRGTGEIVLDGAGTWMAHQGVRLEAPHVVADPETTALRATGGVRADMEQEAGFSLGVGAEGREEAVHVVSEEATYHPVEGFRFVDDVRAWQGRNYLLARTFGGTGERVTAEGSVKTVWHDAAEPGARRRPRQAPAADGESGGATTAEADGEGGQAATAEADSEELASPLEARREADAADAQRPLEVFAQQLVWESGAGIVEYQGAARAQQGRRNMRCANIRVHLDDDNEVELMECDGPVQIEDPAGGNKVYGDAAEYRPGADTVLVLGDPVRLVETSGAQFEGKAMRYDFTSGRAELDSQSGREEVPFDERTATVAGSAVELVDGPELLQSRRGDAAEGVVTIAGPVWTAWEVVQPEIEEPAAGETGAEEDDAVSIAAGDRPLRPLSGATDPKAPEVPSGETRLPTGGEPPPRGVEPPLAGGVEPPLPPGAEAPLPPGAVAPRPPAEPEPSPPIDVYASRLSYDLRARTVSLQGAIRYRQGTRSMRCAELRLHLTRDQLVDWVECSGSAQIQDTSIGDVVSGAIARYETVGTEIVVTGSPARLRRSSGVEMEGDTLVYEFGTGRVQLPGAADGTGEEPVDGDAEEPANGDGAAQAPLSGDAAEPASDQGDAPEPAGRNGDAVEPASDQGEAPEPAGRNGDAVELASDQGDATEPAGRNGDAVEPARGEGDALGPAGGDGEAGGA